MIYIACGCLMMVISVTWFIFPAKKPNRLYGYLSYLAQVNRDSFKYAQRKATLAFFVIGLIQFLLGLAIHLLNADRFFIIWLLTFYIFLLLPIIWTEKSLQKFLKKNNALPHDYVEPDKIKRHKTKGFRD